MKFDHAPIAKIAAWATLCISICGCGAGSYDRNQQVSVHDDDTIAYSVNFEARLNTRLMLQGQVNRISLSDSQALQRRSTGRDVLRVDDIIWEGPDNLNKDVEIRDFGLVLMASPVNNDFLEVNLGGGLRHLNGDLMLGNRSRQINIGVIDEFGLSVDSYVKYKFHPELALSGGITGGHFDSSRSSHMASLGFHWTPVKHVQVDLGLFRYTYENDLSSRYDNTGDYQLQLRRVDEFDTCSDEAGSTNCPQGDYDSPFKVKARGLKAGITFSF
ncbi:MAG TPA: hypothetical protein VIC26_15705 [Marinagarivorans sp.]